MKNRTKKKRTVSVEAYAHSREGLHILKAKAYRNKNLPDIIAELVDAKLITIREKV